MSEKPLIRVTEPRLGSITNRGFHLFRLALLGSFAYWLISDSASVSSLTRGLVTSALLVCLWSSWYYARRWSDTALVLELTRQTLSFSLQPRQPLRLVPLADISGIRYHTHLLVVDTKTQGPVQLLFPLKHRQHLARLRDELARLLPQVPQTPV